MSNNIICKHDDCNNETFYNNIRHSECAGHLLVSSFDYLEYLNRTLNETTDDDYCDEIVDDIEHTKRLIETIKYELDQQHKRELELENHWFTKYTKGNDLNTADKWFINQVELCGSDREQFINQFSNKESLRQTLYLEWNKFYQQHNTTPDRVRASLTYDWSIEF